VATTLVTVSASSPASSSWRWAALWRSCGIALSSGESVSRSPGRRPLYDRGLSVSDCCGGGSDGPSVGSCICGVCVERPWVPPDLVVLLLLSAIMNVAPEPGTLSLLLLLLASYEDTGRVINSTWRSSILKTFKFTC